MVPARQQRAGNVATRGKWPVALHRLRELERLTLAEELVAQRLREHASFRPAPHLASDGIDHDEIVRLTRGEVELHVLPGIVHDVEREADLGAVGADEQVRAQAGARFFAALRGHFSLLGNEQRRGLRELDAVLLECGGFVIRARAAREYHGAYTEKGDQDARTHRFCRNGVWAAFHEASCAAHKRGRAELINWGQQSQHQVLAASDDWAVTSVTVHLSRTTPLRLP